MITAEKPLYVKDVTGFHLFAHRCECGEMNVHGFYSQLEKRIDRVKRRAFATFPCRKCKRVRKRAIRLTTGKYRKRLRLFRWIDWSLLVLKIIPERMNRFARWVLFTATYLEAKFPL